MRLTRTLAVTLAAATFAVGCASQADDPAAPGGPQPDVELISLRQLDSCGDLRDWAAAELAPRVGAYGLDGVSAENGGPIAQEDGGPTARTDDGSDAAGGDGAGDSGAGDADAPATTGPSAAPQAPLAAGGDSGGRAMDSAESADSAGSGAESSAGSADAAPDAPSDAPPTPDPSAPFSGTNVQVEGVDEADVVKTDGERVLALSEGELHLASAGSTELVDSLELPGDLHDAEMLVAGDRVLVFGTGPEAWAVDEPASAGTAREQSIVPPTGSPGTTVVQVDVGDDGLAVAGTYALNGTYVSARMIDGIARLVVHADPQQRLGFVTPAGPTEEAEQRAIELNRQVVEEAAPEDLLPGWHQLGPDGEVTGDGGTVVPCEAAHVPGRFSGFGMVTVVTLDPAADLAQALAAQPAAGVMAGGETVYASAEHLYVAAPAWPGDAVPLGTGDADDADDAVTEEPGTDIHRFELSGTDRAAYTMSGHVDGRLLNQFAMDEHDGHLRVATTTGSPDDEGAGESESHVVVLAPGDDRLAEVGRVSGLGRGESIFSVRFLGDVGYVVTFEQTDPLYTIDLSRPESPEVTGELEILGYSAYLHPVADGFLLGIGQDATEGGTTVGTQVSLFDVRDPAAPTRVAQATLSDSSSDAESDHRAFLWWAEDGLAAIPVDGYGSDGGTAFTGLVGFDVDVDGGSIAERGRVAHPGEADDIGGGSDPVPLPRPVPPTSGSDAVAIAPSDDAPPITRSLVIGERLWTLSDAGLGASDLATLGSTDFVPFG